MMAEEKTKRTEKKKEQRQAEKKEAKDRMANKMRQISIEKVVLSVGATGEETVVYAHRKETGEDGIQEKDPCPWSQAKAGGGGGSHDKKRDRGNPKEDAGDQRRHLEEETGS